MVLIALLSAVALHTSAQDKIYKKDGQIIEAKVYQVSLDGIVFRMFDNLTGPEYTIPKGDVMKIVYSNGSSDVFKESKELIGVDDHEKSIGAKKYASKKEMFKNKNIIAVAPLQFTENGFGLAVSFERSLDKSGWVSFYLPAIYTFSNTTQENYSTGQTTSQFTSPMFYLEPGIKIYTNANSRGHVKFSLGPSLVLGIGNRTESTVDYNTGSNYNATQNRFLMGALLNFGWSIVTTEHLYMGFDFGLGMTYINQEGGVGQGTGFLTQGGVRVGYKFNAKNR